MEDFNFLPAGIQGKPRCIGDNQTEGNQNHPGEEYPKTLGEIEEQLGLAEHPLRVYDFLHPIQFVEAFRQAPDTFPVVHEHLEIDGVGQTSLFRTGEKAVVRPTPS